MKRKKIFYVPGMISLVVLPLAVLLFTAYDNSDEKGYLRMYLPKNDPNYNKNMPSYSGQGLLETIKDYKKTEIYLNDNWYLTEQKFDFIFHELQRLSFTNPKKEVLIVHMNEKTTFEDFVRLLDMANFTMLKRYAYWNDEWYFMGD